MDGPPVVFVLFLLVAIALIGLGLYQAHLRREMWRKLADRYGFRYYEGDPFDLRHAEPDFDLFDRGHSRKVYNTLDGTWNGLPVRVFDFRYKTGSGKNETTHRLTAALADLTIRCPSLTIRPEHFGDWIASALGFDDIDFEFEEFNREFHVSGDDKKFAYDVCHPQMMEFLLSATEFCWEIRGGRLLLYSHRLRDFDEAEFERALRLLEGFVTRIPEYLRKD